MNDKTSKKFTKITASYFQVKCVINIKADLIAGPHHRKVWYLVLVHVCNCPQPYLNNIKLRVKQAAAVTKKK